MANNMRFIWSFSTTCRKKLFLEKQIQFGTVNKKTENTQIFLFYANTSNALSNSPNKN